MQAYKSKNIKEDGNKQIKEQTPEETLQGIEKIVILNRVKWIYSKEGKKNYVHKYGKRLLYFFKKTHSRKR